MRSRVGKSECSESEAFVGTRGRRADGETFDSEREGGFRGRLQGGASGGKPQVLPLAFQTFKQNAITDFFYSLN